MLNFLALLFLVLPLLGDEETERIFTNLYQTAAWGVNEEGIGSSGPDSQLENSLEYIAFLQDFIRQNKIRTVLDVGCGDWSFSKAIRWGNVRYIGIDIVKPVIERNQKIYGSDKVTFLCGDMCEMELPKADLIICKDVLQYLPKSKINKFLKITDTYKYCLLVNDLDQSGENKSVVTGDHRPLDLTEPPFHVEGANIFSFQAKQVLLKTGPTKQQKGPKRCFAIHEVHPYQGFFSVFMTVMNYLDLYDKKEIDGLVVDFQKHGLCYEDSYGPNSWGYYFNPIQLGCTSGPIVEFDYSKADETGRVAYLAEIGLSRQRVADLMQKYVQVKPAILEEVDKYVTDHFQDKFIIGVHYRGTDKSGEALRVSYEEVSAAVAHYTGDKKNFALYVATDETGFLQYMQQTFEGKILSQNCLRSDDQQSPVHYFNSHNKSPYKTGQEALIDCLLLSRCHHLIKTSSCLSLVSTFFNPDLSYVELNQRKTNCYRRF